MLWLRNPEKLMFMIVEPALGGVSTTYCGSDLNAIHSLTC